MANRSGRKPKPIKGVFEHPADSGIWWINYYAMGPGIAKKWAADPTP